MLLASLISDVRPRSDEGFGTVAVVVIVVIAVAVIIAGTYRRRSKPSSGPSASD